MFQWVYNISLDVTRCRYSVVTTSGFGHPRVPSVDGIHCPFLRTPERDIGSTIDHLEGGLKPEIDSNNYSEISSKSICAR